MRLWTLIFVALFARFTDAQAVDPARRLAGATVSGVVRDSIGRKPLADASVQLVAADSPARFGMTATSDSLGQFALNDVPAGHYMIGFFHPVLDSLGVDAPLRELYVDSGQPVHADLAIPSAARIRGAICGVPAAGDPGAVVVGIVRSAKDGAPAAGVTVAAEWLELSLGKGGLISRNPRIVATTGEKGWFAMCNVPTTGTVALRASRGPDSTDVIEVDLAGEGLLRRELFLESSPAVPGGDSETAAPLSPLASARPAGDGTLSGTVVAVAGKRPVSGAQITMFDGNSARSNERGEWTLSNAATGTRMIEVRALGYYPARRQVHIVAGAAPVRVELATLKSVLDTVKVRSTRLLGADRFGFVGRSRTGIGRYLSPDDIARRPAIQTSDLFRTMSGLRLGYASDTLATDMMQRVAPDSTREFARRVLMHGISGNWCAPAIFLDGIRMPGLTSEDIDAWVRPEKVAGIEVYTEASVPGEFLVPRSGCGSIVIWSK
jgi:Carboxypeptidase regulatory-like domain